MGKPPLGRVMPSSRARALKRAWTATSLPTAVAATTALALASSRDGRAAHEDPDMLHSEGCAFPWNAAFALRGPRALKRVPQRNSLLLHAPASPIGARWPFHPGVLAACGVQELHGGAGPCAGAAAQQLPAGRALAT